MARIKSSDAAAIGVKLAAREPFLTGAQLSGWPGSVGAASVGQLPKEWHDTVQANADYVVVSYHTPIAWHERGIGWVRPLVTYSQTTTRHQKTIDEAIGRIAPGSVELMTVGYEGAYIREE